MTNEGIGFALPSGMEGTIQSISAQREATGIESIAAQSLGLPDAVLDGRTILGHTVIDRFSCQSPSGQSETTCRLEILKLSDGHVMAIATELADNEGPSITNASDFFIPAVYAAHLASYDLDDVEFIEHYRSDLSYRNEASEWETYDRVLIENNSGQPSAIGWERLFHFQDEHQ